MYLSESRKSFEFPRLKKSVRRIKSKHKFAMGVTVDIEDIAPFKLHPITTLSLAERQRREMQKPGPTAQVTAQSKSSSAEGAECIRRTSLFRPYRAQGSNWGVDSGGGALRACPRLLSVTPSA
jgi:hypothetical protein